MIEGISGLPDYLDKLNGASFLRHQISLTYRYRISQGSEASYQAFQSVARPHRLKTCPIDRTIWRHLLLDMHKYCEVAIDGSTHMSAFTPPSQYR